ncbi:MAG: transglutaminase-like domain-containing protein [Thermoplasmatales archaeon]
MILVRTFVFTFLCQLLDITYKTTINPVLAAALFFAGSLAGRYFFRARLRPTGYLILIFAVATVALTALYFLTKVLNFTAYLASDFLFDVKLYGGILVYSLVSISLCSVSRSFLILEGLLIVTFLMLGLEEARNLNLSVSKFIYDYSSLFGLKDVTFVSLLGGLLGFSYLIWIFFQTSSTKNLKGILGWSVVAGAIALLVSLTIADRAQKMSRESPMGVGFEDNEDQTPLSFDSLVGTSQQATSLVKLGRTYFDPRTSPMLYFRESALSKFNGRELVKSEFDKDIPKSSPAVSQEIPVAISSTKRVPLQQEVYLLITHSVPFSVDLGYRFNPILNPNPKKFFGGAYSADSAAPVFESEELENLPLGSKSWTQLEWENYTFVHPDPRYSRLAHEVTRFATNPLEQIGTLITFINKNYIYTVKPNHKVAPGEDPVAPFLFGDKRGYCVHIAHSLVYMFRSLGIPSRIGVGYATDLSQSKDGYILLRMNDRHAWPEVYFDGVGWVVFDAQPEQVESHVEAPVDENLLRSLIDEVENQKVDSQSQVDGTVEASKSSFIWLVFGFLVGVYFFVKAYLWFGYLLFQDKYHLALSVLSRLYDTGGSRSESESLEAFISRLNDTENAREEILRLFFSSSTSVDRYPKISFVGYLLGFFNPSSVIRYFLIRRW